MESKIVRPKAKEVQQRFFQAIDMLISSRRISGLKTFCSDYQLHRPKYSNIKNHLEDPAGGTGYKFIDIDALSYIVEDYEVSAEWLLTGKGGMFKNQR